MLREWAVHYLRRRKVGYDDFLGGLEEVVLNQIQRVLLHRHMPPLIRGDMPAPFPRHPLLGHLAIYTINLVILRVALSSEGFVFNESLIDAHEDGTRPWDQLAHLWRSWFSLENLNGLTAVFSANRLRTGDGTGGGKITSEVRITPKKALQVSEGNGRLETYLNVSAALADNIGMGLAGLLTYNPGSDNRFALNTIAEALESEGIDARLQVVVKALLEAKGGSGEHGMPERGYQMLSEVLGRALESGRLEELHVALGLIATRYRWSGLRLAEEHYRGRRFEHRMHPEASLEFIWMMVSGGRRRYLGIDDNERRYWRPGGEREYEGRDYEFLHPQQVMELLERVPELGIEILRSASENGAMEVSRYWRDVQEHLVASGFLEHLAERSPEAALDLIDLFAFSRGSALSFETTRKLVAKLERSERLERVASRRPELIIALSRVLPPDLSEHLLKKLERPLCEGILSPGVLIGVVERRPDAAILLLQRCASTDGLTDLKRRSKARRRFSEELLYPPFLVQICDRHEAVGVELLRLLPSVFPEEALQRYFDELCDILMRGPRLTEYISLKPLFVSELFRFSQNFDPNRFVGPVSEAMSGLLEKPELLERFVQGSPIGFVVHVIEILELGGNGSGAERLRRAVAANLASVR
jgi:hypothetical protein